MNKTSSLSVVAAVLVAAAGFAAPVLADQDDPMTPFNEDIVLQQLHQQGVNATDLQEWNGQIRATVTTADGSTSFQFFDADTLKPVGAGNGNTRVLSQLDVGRSAPALDNKSLTAVNQDDLD